MHARHHSPHPKPAQGRAWLALVPGLLLASGAVAALTGAWTLTTSGTNNVADSSILGTPVSLVFPTAITQVNGTLNTTNFWSDPYGATVAGAPSLQLAVPGDATARTVTVTFGKAVNNPVLHADRLGGQSGGTSNSSAWTLTGATAQSGTVTPERLAGNAQFVLTGNTFQRTPNALNTQAVAECSTATDTTGCGTIRFNGTGVTQLVFSVVMVGPPAMGDGLEFSWSAQGSTVTYRKQSVGGTASFGFTGTNGVGASTLNTATSNPATSAIYAITDNTQPVTITEATVPAGYLLSGASCVNQTTGASVASTLDAGTRALTIAGNAYQANMAILCTFTNNLTADLQVTKSNGVNGVTSGSSTTYTVTVTNNGPGTVIGPALRDTPSAGLTCPAANPVSCTGTGCPAGAVTVGNLVSGVTLGTLPAGTSAVFSFTCQVQ